MMGYQWAPLPYLAAAYGLAVIAIGAYTFFLVSQYRRLRQEWAALGTHHDSLTD